METGRLHYCSILASSACPLGLGRTGGFTSFYTSCTTHITCLTASPHLPLYMRRKDTIASLFLTCHTPLHCMHGCCRAMPFHLPASHLPAWPPHPLFLPHYAMHIFCLTSFIHTMHLCTTMPPHTYMPLLSHTFLATMQKRHVHTPWAGLGQTGAGAGQANTSHTALRPLSTLCCLPCLPISFPTFFLSSSHLPACKLPPPAFSWRGHGGRALPSSTSFETQGRQTRTWTVRRGKGREKRREERGLQGGLGAHTCLRSLRAHVPAWQHLQYLIWAGKEVSAAAAAPSVFLCAATHASASSPAAAFWEGGRTFAMPAWREGAHNSHTLPLCVEGRTCCCAARCAHVHTHTGRRKDSDRGRVGKEGGGGMSLLPLSCTRTSRL